MTEFRMDASTQNMARYVAVTRRDVSTSLRHLPFQPRWEQRAGT